MMETTSLWRYSNPKLSIDCHCETLRSNPGEMASSRTPRHDTIHLGLLYVVVLLVGAMILMPRLADGQIRQLQTELESIERTRGLNVGVTDQQGQQVILYKESHALVIGISNYTNGWPSLPGVRKDVAEVRAVLEGLGFNVVVHTDLDKISLDQAFDDFISHYGHDPENRLLFYFAGHGHTVRTTYGEELGYIVPADAPNPNRDLPGFQKTAMEMQQIEIYAKRIQSKHALFLFDACFSGSLFALSRAVPAIISYKTANPVRQFITSGSADETVPDTSIFRAQFVQALQGEADGDGDGYITGTELGEFLQKTVVNYSYNAQHPQYGKIRNPNLDKGDFVFIGVFAQQAEPKAEPTPVMDKPTEIASSIDNVTEEAEPMIADESPIYNIVGKWLYRQDNPDWQGVASGSIRFAGTAVSGNVQRIDEKDGTMDQGTYTVFDTMRITITSSEQSWTGYFETLNLLRGTWYMIDNPDVRGTWRVDSPDESPLESIPPSISGDVPTYNIVGNWTYRQDDSEWQGVAEGPIGFVGAPARGKFNRIDHRHSETYYGDYTVDDQQVTITNSQQQWIGYFETPDHIQGTWHMIDNPDVKGTWQIKKVD